LSYNIDTHVLVSGNLTLTGAQIRAFLEEGDRLPEDCHLLDFDAEDLDPEKTYDFEPSWRASGSGWSYEDVLLKKVLPATRGSADIIYTWEGGDSFTGIRVVDGVVTRHEVEMVLGAEIRK
jgi:hypothetical protein